MRSRASTAAVIAAAAALPVTVALAAAGDSGEPLRSAQGAEARHQLLGDWRLGSQARFRFTAADGLVEGRALRAFNTGRCTVRRGALVFRAYGFQRSDGAVDLWNGRLALPGRRCRPVGRASTLAVESDLRLTETSRRGGKEVSRTMTRIRPRARDGDPVLGAWERNGLGVVVRRAGDRYLGRARESYLIANGCTIPAGEVVWRLRPAAPGRYDGITRTYLPPPGCTAGRSSESRWQLSDDGARLDREGSEGEVVEYRRAGP